MYTFLKHKIKKNTQELCKQEKKNMCKSNEVTVLEMSKYWTIINTRILYHAVVEVVLHNKAILCKMTTLIACTLKRKD